MTRIGETALVAGRSMAGLAAAAALSRYFDRVVIVDKDPVTDTAEVRPGVGQGHHLHNLLKGGEQALERLLPGASAALIARGAVQVRQTTDHRVYDHGQWLPQRDLGFSLLFALRPLIEQVTLNRLLREPAIDVRGDCAIEGLSFDAARRVNGVSLRTASGAHEVLAADLVVDCLGRLSRAGEGLTVHGYDKVREFKINIGLSYTSAIFEMPGDVSEAYKALGVIPNPPRKRGAFASQIEGGKWLVSLHTRFEKKLPASHDEMIAFARDIEVPDVADFLTRAKIQGPVRSYRKPDATWRRYDKIEHFPDGLVVMGDAMASFNPIYAQGMSVAWLQACALDEVLQGRAADQRGLDGLASDFFPRAMQFSREAWNTSTLVDAAYDEVTGDTWPGSEQSLVFLRALRTLLPDDPELHADYIGVGHMIIPGSALRRGDRTARVMAAAAKL